MAYEDIIQGIDNLNEINFTMDSLRSVGSLYKALSCIYSNELKEKKLDAKINYMMVKEHLNETLFNILKEKLGFEDEIIEKIVYYLHFAERIQEIYVLDGNVIIKVTSNIHDEPKTISYFVPNNGFRDVASRGFIEDLNLEVYKAFFVDAMNKAVRPKFHNSLLKLEDKEIRYRFVDMNIYVNKSLKELMKINTDVTGEVAKIIIEYDHEKLFYYDMKIHYSYIELVPNEYHVHVVSEMLNEKSKTKRR